MLNANFFSPNVCYSLSINRAKVVESHDRHVGVDNASIKTQFLCQDAVASQHQ